MISPFRFLRSLRYALRGLVTVARAEHSFRVQLLIGTAAIACAIVLPLATWERILVFLMTAAVLVLEVINSIVERIVDAVHPRLSPMVREVKDMMAGTVFLSSLAAVVVGVMVFGRYLGPAVEWIAGVL
ncbi:diacylglycerol kinase [Candidatus Uhrbacteria bacterium]|nr:diacylglycerol kinase [Candidatus Uhrbacteria bacterium]